jgi:tRNA (guanine-N7-)-methyltransferase
MEQSELGKRSSEHMSIPLNNESLIMPQKRFFRSRAHCNPLSHNDSFVYPRHPSEFSWQELYPNIPESDRIVRVLDMGMGFGGLTVKLAKLLEKELVLGMEIRAKVCEYVRLRIGSLRKEFPGQYENAACLRTNCMRYLPHYFSKHQLNAVFTCFPDPHFKAKNHRRRIITFELLSEYAYFIKPGGRLYTITDVEELYQWHVEKCDSHPFYRRITDEDALSSDPAVTAMKYDTEEGKKVERAGGKKFIAVYERLEDAERKCQEQPKMLQLWA